METFWYRLTQIRLENGCLNGERILCELHVEGAAAKVEEEPPAKLVDDLFRKTKALPCIYWLPLTDEQV